MNDALFNYAVPLIVAVGFLSIVGELWAILKRLDRIEGFQQGLFDAGQRFTEEEEKRNRNLFDELN
jgi:hypothetical protein